MQVAQQGSGRAPLTAMELHLLANPRLLDTHMQVGVVVVVVMSVGGNGGMTDRGRPSEMHPRLCLHGA